MKLQVAARAALVVAALLGGAVPLLKERGEPVTRLVISNSSPLALQAAAFRHDVDCTDARAASFDGPDAVLDMPAKPWETVAFSYSDARHGAVSTCTGVASFRADQRHEYHVDVGEARGACGMRVTRRIAGSQDPLIPVEIEPREPAVAATAAATARTAHRPAAIAVPTRRGAACRTDARFQQAASGPSS